jgi:hypothetical protein
MLIDLSWTWHHLQIQHILDVMHIENNICESLVRFIFGQNDTINVQRDMEAKCT